MVCWHPPGRRLVPPNFTLDVTICILRMRLVWLVLFFVVFFFVLYGYMNVDIDVLGKRIVKPYVIAGVDG